MACIERECSKRYKRFVPEVMKKERFVAFLIADDL